jgi:hypothetical protein
MSAIAQEQQSKGGPVAPNLYLEEIRWAVASASDVEAAYSYALDANIPNPGGDESVITDGMILSSVQANWPASA